MPSEPSPRTPARRATRKNWIAFGLSALLASCGEEKPEVVPCVPPELILALSDASSSGFVGRTLDGGSRASYGIELGRDVVLAESGDRHFLVARLEDRVFPVDLACGTLTAPFSTKPSTGLGNPQDVAVSASGSRWVSLFDTPRVLEVNEAGTTLGDVDLSAFDDDGNPNASGLTVVSSDGVERLLVALERLENRATDPNDYLQSTRPSHLVEIDPSQRIVTRDRPLAGRNPFGPFVRNGESLFVATLGSVRYDDEIDAGIVRIDPNTLDSRLLASERALGGSVGAVAFSGGCGAAIVLGPSPANPTSLVLFDALSGEIRMGKVTSPLKSDQFSLTALAFRGSSLFVGDKRKSERGYPLDRLTIAGDCTATLDPAEAYYPLPVVSIQAVP